MTVGQFLITIKPVAHALHYELRHSPVPAAGDAPNQSFGGGGNEEASPKQPTTGGWNYRRGSRSDNLNSMKSRPRALLGAAWMVIVSSVAPLLAHSVVQSERSARLVQSTVGKKDAPPSRILKWARSHVWKSKWERHGQIVQTGMVSCTVDNQGYVIFSAYSNGDGMLTFFDSTIGDRESVEKGGYCSEHFDQPPVAVERKYNCRIHISLSNFETKLEFISHQLPS